MNIAGARGLTVSFRFVEVDDAEYILSLRLNLELNRYISPTDPSVEKQREWLAACKERELSGKEYYYIVINHNNDKPCGVIRLYNFNNGIFEWGSLILDDNKTPSAAIEAAFFIYRIAFDLLEFDKSHFTVHKENTRTVIFQKRLGARIIGERQTQIGAEHLFEFDKNDWLLAQQKFKKFMPAPYEATTRRAFQKHRQ